MGKTNIDARTLKNRPSLLCLVVWRNNPSCRFPSPAQAGAAVLGTRLWAELRRAAEDRPTLAPAGYRPGDDQHRAKLRLWQALAVCCNFVAGDSPAGGDRTEVDTAEGLVAGHVLVGNGRAEGGAAGKPSASTGAAAEALGFVWSQLAVRGNLASVKTFMEVIVVRLLPAVPDAFDALVLRELIGHPGQADGDCARVSASVIAMLSLLRLPLGRRGSEARFCEMATAAVDALLPLCVCGAGVWWIGRCEG